ncbi:MAG: hypothetical protein FJW88_09980 [Actinobacteria bacterium]|nr:hypothetical protein [Actinomycetota bacterium]
MTTEHVLGTIVLLGGDEWTAATRELDAALLAASGSSEVVVLPTPKAFEHPERVGPRAEAYFSGLGATVRTLHVISRRDSEADDVVSAVEAARFVYLPDGSSLHLRPVLKGGRLEEALLSAFRAGAVLAASGESAMVMCDPMVDRRGGAYTVGLGIVEGVAVDPHYNRLSPESRARPHQLLPKGTVLVGIDDGTALVRAPGGVWSVRGTGTVTVFEQGRDVAYRDGATGLPLP